MGLLTLGFFWLHDLVISLLGMAMLVFANDFVTMSLATDNVKHTGNPNKWNVRNITFASALISVFLITEGWLTILIGRNYFHLNHQELLTFVLLMLIFTSQFRVLIVRERQHFGESVPGLTLRLATGAALAVFAFLGIAGFILTSLLAYQVFIILVFSGLFTLLVDVPKYYAFRKFDL